MKKKILNVITILLLIICTLSILLTATILTATNFIKVKSSDMIPIEDITGINTPATLRKGCHIKEGVAYVAGMLAHGMIIAGGPFSEGEEGLNVSWIRIIDVYGSNCTIVFSCSDDPNGGQWIETDYPLSNLRYDALKVRLADDGIKSDIYSRTFTINGGGHRGRVGPLLWILDIIGVATYVFLIVRKVRGRGKGQFEYEGLPHMDRDYLLEGDEFL